MFHLTEKRMHKPQAELYLQYIFFSIYKRITWFPMRKACLGWLLAREMCHNETAHHALLERNTSCVTTASGWSSTIIFVWSSMHMWLTWLVCCCAELLASDCLFFTLSSEAKSWYATSVFIPSAFLEVPSSLNTTC